MSETVTLPLLSLPDVVVLPGMVVPVELDADARPVGRRRPGRRRAGEAGRLLLAPRLADRYPTHGVVATIEQVGRLPGGERGRRAPRRWPRPHRLRRTRSRRGAVGRGRAGRDRRAHRAGPRAGRGVPQGRHRDPPAPQRLAGRRRRAADHRPVRAGRPGRLRAVPHRRAEARAARDPRRRGPADHACWPGRATTSPSWR